MIQVLLNHNIGAEIEVEATTDVCIKIFGQDIYVLKI